MTRRLTKSNVIVKSPSLLEVLVSHTFLLHRIFSFVFPTPCLWTVLLKVGSSRVKWNALLGGLKVNLRRKHFDHKLIFLDQ